MPPDPSLTPFERFLTLFTKMRAGEGKSVLLLWLNAFLLLLAYYTIKPVRESLILDEWGAEIKSYAIAAIALTLLFLVPLYSALFRQVHKIRLVQWITLFFVSNLAVFYLMGVAGMEFSFVFYVWVGIFSVMLPAQFWAFAADLFNVKSGQRLFPVIMVGAASGALAGAQISKALFPTIGPYGLMLVCGVILLTTLVFATPAKAAVPEESRSTPTITPESRIEKLIGGFGIVMGDAYLRMLALFVVLLNWINATGEYILAEVVIRYADGLIAAGQAVLNRDAIINAVYGDFLFFVTLFGLLIQLFLVSRIFRFFGVAGAVLLGPILATLGYALIAFVPIFSIIRLVKIAENSTDYSLTNTARHALYLPTSREAKYEGKTAIDTFFWRFGDLLQAGVVYIGLNVFAWDVQVFAIFTMVLAVCWILVAFLTGREYKRLAIENVLNVPPRLAKPLVDAYWDPSRPFIHTFPLDTFCDADPGDVLTYTAHVHGGVPLPSWLRFNPGRRTFHGQPPAEWREEVRIEVLATDFDGLSASGTFTLSHVSMRKNQP